MTARRATLPEPVDVAHWWKNRRGQAIRVRLSTYKDYNVVDVRTWFTGSDGKMKPAKGFCCSVKHLPKLIDVFGKALAQAIALGLVDGEAGADE